MSKQLKDKYNESLQLYEKMHSDFQHKRPNCEQILNKKDLWALEEQEFQIDDEVKKELIRKFNDENQIVFSVLKSKLNI
jgi:hypothetical protein